MKPAKLDRYFTVPCLTGYDHRYGDTGICVRCGVVRDWIPVPTKQNAPKKAVSAKKTRPEIATGKVYAQSGIPCAEGWEHNIRGGYDYCIDCGLPKTTLFREPTKARPGNTAKIDDSLLPADFGISSRHKFLAKRDGKKCWYCQATYLPLTIDHVIPKSRVGGVNALTNCRLACVVCNTDKADRTPEEWIDRWYLRKG